MSRYLSLVEELQIAGMVERLPTGEVLVRHATMGRVEIDETKCTGCQLCVKACPATSLEMDGPKNVRMLGNHAACIGCSDCVAICKPEAIRLVRPMSYEGFYKHIGRGEVKAPRRF
jgi:NAD-dependent dihydropyrimidine dehydrogenase PreA subunit